MSTSTPNMVLTKPDPDGSVGTWDTELNASLDVIDSHDHSAGKGVKVPVAGIDIDADLSFAGFGATALKVVDLAAVLASTVTGYPTALFCNSADDELYWRTSGGVDVQLTSGNSLNAALLGGFTGDYGSGGSEANFNSGTSIYNFLRAANHRAFIDSSDIRLFQGTSGITNAVKIRSPNSLAASYDFILPTALPAAAAVLEVGSTGQVAATRLIAAGTFTPTLNNNGVPHGTFSAQQGRYMRLGDFVFFQLRIVATSLDPAGVLLIPAASLPVTPSVSSVNTHSASVCQFIGAATPPTRCFARIDLAGIILQEDVGVAVSTNWSALNSATYTIVIGGNYLAA
jgi:hypothetical protein